MSFRKQKKENMSGNCFTLAVYQTVACMQHYICLKTNGCQIITKEMATNNVQRKKRCSESLKTLAHDHFKRLEKLFNLNLSIKKYCGLLVDHWDG